jgi:predicted Rossmann fold nucleotide-binding protein DprA/Smf involved in DNA uptake
MPCVKPDGTLSTTGRLMLSAVQTDSTVEDVATTTGMALYRVRSVLRELVEAGLVAEANGRFSRT